jgi:hypothetical protein
MLPPISHCQAVIGRALVLNDSVPEHMSRLNFNYRHPSCRLLPFSPFFSFLFLALGHGLALALYSRRSNGPNYVHYSGRKKNNAPLGGFLEPSHHSGRVSTVLVCLDAPLRHSLLPTLCHCTAYQHVALPYTYPKMTAVLWQTRLCLRTAICLYSMNIVHSVL